MWNTLSPYYSYDFVGKQVAKQADNNADVGVWRKRMPACNGLDRDCNIISHENEQTSTWS
ncbi:MAG: hypothetical protein K2P53_06255 [Rickettsiales bacterium]|jgi:hypothetical protein|nr:hypothetical protein [Rickettsiales bacterium]